MRRTSTLEWNVDLNQDKEYPGWIALHVEKTRLQLFLRDGTHGDSSVTCMEISMTELLQIKFMIDKSVEALAQFNTDARLAKFDDALNKNIQNIAERGTIEQ